MNAVRLAVCEQYDRGGAFVLEKNAVLHVLCKSSIFKLFTWRARWMQHSIQLSVFVH